MILIPIINMFIIILMIISMLFVIIMIIIFFIHVYKYMYLYLSNNIICTPMAQTPVWLLSMNGGENLAD